MMTCQLTFKKIFVIIITNKEGVPLPKRWNIKEGVSLPISQR